MSAATAARTEYPIIAGPETVDEVKDARIAVCKREPGSVHVIVQVGDIRIRAELVIIGCYEQVGMGRPTGIMYWSGCLPADFARWSTLSTRDQLDLLFEAVDYRPAEGKGTLRVPKAYGDLSDALRRTPDLFRV